MASPEFSEAWSYLFSSSLSLLLPAANPSHTEVDQEGSYVGVESKGVL